MKNLSSILDTERNKKEAIQKGLKITGELEELIMPQVQQAMAQAESYRATRTEHANENRLYYHTKLPGRLDSTEISQHKEPLAYMTVKAAIPQLYDSFVSNKRLAASFANRGYIKNPDLDKLVEYNVNMILLGKNKGGLLLKQCIKSILIDSNAPVTAFIDEPIYTQEDTLDDWIDCALYLSTLSEGWDLSQKVQAKLNKADNGKYKGFQWDWRKPKAPKQEDTNPLTGEPMEQPEQEQPEALFIKGTIPLERTDKEIKIEQIDLSDFWFDVSCGEDFDKTRHITRRIKTTVGEAELRGFDPDKLAEAAMSKSDYSKLPTGYAVDYNSPATAGAVDQLEIPDSTDPKERRIELYETYLYTSYVTKNGEQRLVKVTHDGKTCYRIEPVKRFPFVYGAAELVNGDAQASGLVDRVKALQNTISRMRRLQIDNAALGVNPRYLAIKGQYDRQSLIQNRPGAVVEQMAAGSVEYMVRPPMPTEFFQCVTDLRAVAGDVMVQPTNAANSDGGIPQISTATLALKLKTDAMQGMELSNTVGDTLLEPLLDLIYELIRDEKLDLETPTGEIIKQKDLKRIFGAELPQLYKWVVDIQTTNDDTAKAINLSNMMGSILQLQQGIGNLITADNVFNFAEDVAELSDLPKGRYVTDPRTMEQDPHAAEQKALDQVMEDNLKRVTVQHEEAKYLLTMAQKAQTDAETVELIKNGIVERAVKQQEAQTKSNKVITESELDKEKNVISAQKAETEDRRVTLDASLGIVKAQTDHHANRVNGQNI